MCLPVSTETFVIHIAQVLILIKNINFQQAETLRMPNPPAYAMVLPDVPTHSIVCYPEVPQHPIQPFPEVPTHAINSKRQQGER